MSEILRRPVFRFVGPNGVVGEVKKPYVVPSEIVECDISGLIGGISCKGEVSVDVVERGPRDAATVLESSADAGVVLENRTPGGVDRGAPGRTAIGETVSVTCILCPDSCLVRVLAEGGELRAEGARCAKGMRYLIKEVTDPRRTFTSSVRVLDGGEPVCPVRISKPIRKDDWRKAMKLVGETAVRAPIRCGETLSRDFLEHRVNLLATMSVDAAGKIVAPLRR